ncbi:MAG: metalloregulator ArsR/SmtB family transcription factor [Planctomycetes bacterium]|nr:metalloregulator ArsR/SmtB family transcription factor [Planctomycetota bacterium]
METLQRAFKTLTDPTRMRILFLLEREELAVQELVQILATAQSTVSRHLGILRESGLLRDRREGTSIYYRFEEPTGSDWSETWRLARRSLASDPTAQRDLASLGVVLRQREVRSRRWFEQVGPEWDDIRRVFNDEVYRARAITRLVPRQLRVADIGTGTGILARELAMVGVNVVAIDRSERMLEAARANLDDRLAARIDFRLGSVDSLPVEDGELDAAMAHMVLHYVASPGEAVQEMARIVRPGGRVVVVEFAQHEHEWLQRELGVVWQGFTSDAVARWFEDAGLVDLDIDLDATVRPSSNSVELPRTFIASATRSDP